jgi:hypothetical protein
MTRAHPTRSLREKVAGIARVVFAVAGVAAVIILVRQVGLRELGALLHRALPWIPLLVVLEAGRIACEAFGTRAICGRDAGRLDIATWIRLHLVANAALVVLPAGRAICEGIKIASMSKAFGAPRAAGLVIIQHSMTMLGLAVISVPCLIAAYTFTGATLITAAIGGHLVLCLVGAFALQIAARRAMVPKMAAKWFVHSEGALDIFRATARSLPWIPVPTLLGKVGNRALQAVQFMVILHAIGTWTSIERGFLADGVNLVGSALGEFMPAQIGAMDGTFAVAATALGVNVAMAMAMANLSRLVQLGWSVVGALVPMIARREQARDTAPSGA